MNNKYGRLSSVRGKTPSHPVIGRVLGDRWSGIGHIENTPSQKSGRKRGMLIDESGRYTGFYCMIIENTEIRLLFISTIVRDNFSLVHNSSMYKKYKK